MKLQDINKIIEDTISEEIKSRIIKEQEEGNDLINKIKSFQSLSPIADKIINASENQGNSLIQISDITPEELMSCCNTQSVDDAIATLNKNLYNDLIKNGFGNNCDVDIDINSDNETNIDLKITITSNEELGSEISEEMENTNKNEFIEGLLRAKENNEETFNVGGQDYDVQEWYSQLEEEEGECSECGQQSMEEQEFEDAPKNTGKGEYGKKETEMTKIFKESELAGVNEPENIVDMEGDYVNESEKSKKVIRLTEDKFIQMISKIIKEAAKPKVVGKEVKANGKGKPFGIKGEPKESEIILPKNVPGLQAVKQAHTGDKREADEYLNSVDKKMKDYLSFEGNDNPEFPNPIGGDKVAHRVEATEEQDYIDTYRGMGTQDAVYDTPPSKEFVDRVKKALVGDSTMGNKQDKDTVNTTKSKLGEKIFKNIKKKRDKIKNDPMYIKDTFPTKDSEKYAKEDVRDPESLPIHENKIINEEINRIKEISSYGKKTQ